MPTCEPWAPSRVGEGVLGVPRQLALLRGLRCACVARRLCTTLSALALSIAAAPGLAADKLVWLTRDLPPLTVFNGPSKDQGVIDQLLPQLIAGMPQYQHSILHVNRARAIQILESPTLSCDPALVWNPARAQSIAYSAAVLGLHSNGLIVRREDVPTISNFINDGHVDIEALLNARVIKLGLIGQRSYGEWIDSRLAAGPASQLSIHYGNDALGSLLQMQQAGRVQGLLGYWPEIRTKAQQQALPADALVFYPIKGTATFEPIYIGCSNTPQGRQIIRRINTLLKNLPHDMLIQSYAQWMEPEQREAYLEAAKAALQAPAAP